MVLKRMLGCIVGKRERKPVLPKHSLGELLVEMGIISETQLQDAVRYQHENADKMLGEALIQMGVLHRELLETLLLKQRALRRRSDRDVIDFARAAAKRSSASGFSVASLSAQDD